MPILSKVPIEDAPASFATLIHVVAGQQLLRTQLWHIRSLQLEACLHSLQEAQSVAGAAMLLVTDWPGEVMAIKISEIVALR